MPTLSGPRLEIPVSIRILTGDAMTVLATMPDESVQTCVTSPPYFGLRDYGTATWEGGDAECSHIQPATGSTQNKGNNGRLGTEYRAVCGDCGAVRIDSQLGLEKTPDEYVAKMVAVFREVRRVLTDDGTLWLNLGDSYNNAGSSRNGEGLDGSRRGGATGPDGEAGYKKRDLRHALRAYGIKHKDLVGIPWMLAFALRADGWYLRSDIIWHKPNPMPESVTDRPTKAHEYVFLLSKSERYYYDADAIAEEAGPAHGIGYRKDAASAFRGNPPTNLAGCGGSADGTRNRRTVWTVATQPYSGAHFATFPPDLIKPCILAGCPAGGTVLDPFGGAGTTGLVADRLNRNAVLIELNPEYADMARKRVTDDAPLFATVTDI